MIRRVSLLVLLLAGVALFVVSRDSGASHDRYKAAAEFDTAKGIVPGQLVKIAGARVGRVNDVRLTPRNTARIEFEVDPEFGPFHADATCRILPEGLISENFVECDPGSPGAALLPGATVPLTRTTVPVSLQDVLNTFDLPASQRVSMLLTGLGLGTAGRGDDINAILRRANPALQDTQDVLGEIASERKSLTAAITQTDQVVSDLRSRQRNVRSFVRNAAATATAAGANAPALSATVRKLPEMLDEAKVGLNAIDDTTKDATPLVSDLRASAPALSRFVTELPRFSAAGRPALRAVSTTAQRTRSALSDVTPVTRDLMRLGTAIAPMARQLGPLAVSLRDTGAAEGLLSFFYALSVSTSLFDNVSHYFSLFAGVAPQCMATTRIDPAPGCDRTYDKPAIPMNSPQQTKAQAQAVIRALKHKPQTTNAVEAAARKLFLSDRFAGKNDRPDADRIKAFLDYLLR